MERIVVGYDGSTASVSALSWVATRARLRPAKVGVVNVVSKFSQNRSGALQTLGKAEEFLDANAPDLDVELHRLEGGMPETITRFAENADLLVVGVNPGHPFRATVSVWMPLRTTTHASVPVCVVPAGWVQSDDAITVGVADDGSSDAALDFAIAEAQATETAMRLVHTWLMPTPSLEGSVALIVTPESVLSQHRQILDAAVALVEAADPAIDVRSELIRDSRSTALLRYTARSSLLVLGTHRRGLLAGSLMGSVAQEVLWRAECPVCVVPGR